jgi:hypothetical protein
MIMQFTRSDNKIPVYVNMDLVTDFFSHSKGTRIRYQSGGGIVVVDDSAKIYQDYCSQIMATR